jgi:hypothetical protein
LPFGFEAPFFSSVEVRPCVCEALANDAFEGFVRPLAIIEAVGNAVVIPDLKFGEIPMQMLLATMLINALHAHLKIEKLPSTV